MRTRRPFGAGVAAIPAALLFFIAAGCGSTGQKSTRLDVELQVAYELARSPLHYEVTCDPAGGNVPDPDALCRALDAHPAMLAPPALAATCAGGPGIPPDIGIRGTAHGNDVNVPSLRSCDMPAARWEAAGLWFRYLAPTVLSVTLRRGLQPPQLFTVQCIPPRALVPNTAACNAIAGHAAMVSPPPALHHCRAPSIRLTVAGVIRGRPVRVSLDDCDSRGPRGQIARLWASSMERDRNGP